MTIPASDDTPPPANELVIGLVGAVGIDLTDVTTAIQVVLGGFNYQVHDVHLSVLMHQLDWDQELVEEPFDEHVWSFMTAGNSLRERWERDDAFALLGISEISRRRAELTGDPDRPADRQAWVLRSLKRPEEAKLLQDVYGSRFILIAAYSPEHIRRRELRRRIEESRVLPHDPAPRYDADRLMKRDQAEGIDHGQAVRQTFHLADFFVDVSNPAETVRKDGSDELRLRVDLERTFAILFGHPNRTPSRDEFGMFQAVAAMRRSAELGRQVGAAVCTKEGDVVAVGVNEVPKPGGGMYWENDPHDAREFTYGRDRSDELKQALAEQIIERLGDQGANLLAPDADSDRVLVEIGRTDLDSLVEYVRAVHAEMAALMDAARRGIAVHDCVLYVTTFPCHHCARHIVAAGICRVVYIAPYSKSRAEELHSDAIVIGTPQDPNDYRVRFVPFVGVGPSRYLQLFDAPKRKEDDGSITEFNPREAEPRLPDLDPPELRADVLAYLRRERRAEDLLAAVQADRPPRVHGAESPGDDELSVRGEGEDGDPEGGNSDPDDHPG